jgi:hypothetical protein
VHAERPLEALITRGNIVPRSSYRIRDPDPLPDTLQQVMFNAAQEGRIWMPWARRLHSWLVTCETPVLLSLERKAVALRVKVYAENGNLMEAGTWAPDTNGKWARCAT